MKRDRRLEFERLRETVRHTPPVLKRIVCWSSDFYRPSQCELPSFRRLLERERQRDYLERAEIEMKVCIEMMISRLVSWQDMRRSRMGATDESLMVDPPKTDVTK